jgi:RNA polymerase sigma factor (sigma-70 family)
MATSLATPHRRYLPALKPRRLLALLDDERLAREVAKGNEAAFEVVYDRHHRGLLSFCRHLLGSTEEAEDALQQTFVSAYSHLTETHSDVRLKPWLYTIARNRCISMIRARHDQPAEDVEPSTDGLHEQVQQRADLRRLLADLQRLPVDQRSALVLSELKGMSHRDVAEVLGCDTRKVKALVFQARSHLIDYRTAHDTPCATVRSELAARKRGAPSGTLRRHVEVCADCARFRDELRKQHAALGLLLPVLPAAGLKSKAFAAAGLAAPSSAGPGAAGGTWIAGHVQALKLAALGAAALSTAAITIPILGHDGQSAHARAAAAAPTSTAPTLVPLAKSSHARPHAAATHRHARRAAHASRHAPAHRRPALATRHRSAPRDVTRAQRRRQSHWRRHAASGGLVQPTVSPDDAQPHTGHAYGHAHAPGWIREHGGDPWPPGRAHGH